MLLDATDGPSDLLYFLGRFHPLLVHLPIGVLLLAILVHFAAKTEKFAALNAFVNYLWAFGAIAAFFTVVLGYLLSLTGNYDQSLVFWHKWSGIVILIIAAACWYLSSNRSKSGLILASVLPILLIITIFYNGHLGGSLTHGPDYLLEYAPNALRKISGLPAKAIKRKKVTEIDSADIFLDVVSPILRDKCTGCHNSGKKEGGLVLNSYNNMMKGGDNEDVIVPGDAANSELFRRINLPQEHEDFMPTEGKLPLTEIEITLLEGWINSGANSEGYATVINPEKQFLIALGSYLGLDRNKILSQQVARANEADIDSLRAVGFIINTLMRDNNLLEADFSLSEQVLKGDHLDLLLKIKEQLIWLDLSNAGITDKQLEQIGSLEKLLKLNLSKNAISDKSLATLARLPNLEVLNLYGNEITDIGLKEFAKFPALKTIYLWQTKVTDSVLGEFIEDHPRLKIIASRAE